MTSWTSLNETSCWVISVLIIFLWRKVELSLSWKLTFVLIKASMLVPDQFNWQVWCLRFVLSLSRPLCTVLALWFGILLLKTRSSAPAVKSFFFFFCLIISVSISAFVFGGQTWQPLMVVHDNRAVVSVSVLREHCLCVYVCFILGIHEIQPVFMVSVFVIDE